MSRQPWFLRGRLRYVAAVALVLDLGVGAFSTAMAVQTGSGTPSREAASAVSVTASAKTVKWTDDRSSYDADYRGESQPDPSDPNQPLFQNLQVTVSQTDDLTDQGVQVTWTGGKPTSPGGAANNFLQIMQCWASPGSNGPTPQQCQWGTPNTNIANQTGMMVSSRDLLLDHAADPKQPTGPELSHAPFGQDASSTIPFWSATDPGKSSLGWTNDPGQAPPYGSAQSNEVTYARTAADGSGQDIFSLQSALSAPYLGCGDPALTRRGYTCWLVVVPRGEYNPNGDKAADEPISAGNYTFVAGSPLTASVWQDRLQFKLGFTSTAAGCPTSGEEVQTAGSELVSEAFSSWQSPLCAQGVKFGYSEIGDAEARSAVLSGGDGAPHLGFVYGPLDPDAAADTTIVYSPVVNSSIVVSYLIDKRYDPGQTDNPDLGANGTLVTDLRLTPLLVAKLLTQSYRNDTPGGGRGTAATVPASNPASLRTDPEFIALNPEFKYFFPSAAPDGLIVPFGDSDAAAAVWAWLRSDPGAESFLKGRPDHWGMVINPAYQGLNLGTDASVSSFPKADQSQFRSGDAPAPGYGTIDMRPFSADFADGAFKTITANNGQKTFWDITKVPPQYVNTGAQTPGERFEIAITTSESAALYGAPTASFVDNYTVPDDDPGVGPSIDAMTSELSGAREEAGVPGVYRVDPQKSPTDGYPLTLPTYAAVNVCAATKAELAAYATFLTYASGPGQVLGTQRGLLPPGYAPLSLDDQHLAAAAAARLSGKDAQAACPDASGGATSAPSAAQSNAATPSATTSVTPSTAPVAAAAAPTAAAPPSASVTAPPRARASATEAKGPLTPAAYVTPAARYAIVAALCFALPCLIGGPTLLLSTRRKR